MSRRRSHAVAGAGDGGPPSAIGAADPAGRDEVGPSGSEAIDPLLDTPPRHTEPEAAHHDRPGSSTPLWFVPSLFVVLVAFTAGLVAIGQRGSEATASTAPGASDADAPRVESTAALAGSPANSGATGSALAPDGDRSDPVELPPPGSVRVGGRTTALTAQCEVHLPLAPSDSELQVSTYAFVDSTGAVAAVDRSFDADGERVSLTGVEPVTATVDEIGDDGAFVAVLSTGSDRALDVVVSPRDDDRCDDRVVTNLPGQFSEPRTLIVLATCSDGALGPGDRSRLAGLTSERGRFSISTAGDGSARVRVSAPALAGSVVLEDPDAEYVVDDRTLSASGVVRGGTDLDLAFDVTLDVSLPGDGATSCTERDRI
ncbi:hypothetical protein [Ilumatobacter sp.]|uniref:hypothetical protein n=1 Tax=Ilumatobacter sp. TaxID=1967498 RepID=UPI003B51B3DB